MTVVAAEGPYGTRSYAAMISCTGPDHVALAEARRRLDEHDEWILRALGRLEPERLLQIIVLLEHLGDANEA